MTRARTAPGRHLLLAKRIFFVGGKPPRPLFFGLARAVAATLCVALLSGVFLAWQDPGITLALLDGVFLCH
ncbi:hypothetical protein CEY04_23800 [Achromobacter sp. HZ28]|nr:hypothetical protein CEY05_24965 [Achromobacter sp. HZ34]OWT73100.1 hypothetical protein CEY04_23800 [Achromobacter sp. HZ28]